MGVSVRWRAWARIAALAGLLALYVGPHLLTKWTTGRSRWPTRFLRRAGRVMGLRVDTDGAPLGRHQLVVANHTSWLDILILGGLGCAFVSKAEIRSTPLVGWLADQNATLYVERAERRDAKGQIARVRAALDRPQALAIFPEGTTTDGRHLLPFNPTLLSAVAPPAPADVVRPVAIDYGAARDEIAWHGAEPGMANVMRVLGRRGTIAVRVRLLEPIVPGDDRKALAAAARAAIGKALALPG
ncbi:lysophospholipid acyltransferase family protein [Sphingomonas sp. ASV193]|uniref:lysophospholipid acyltransferase family protein n=1 Tax=Sphingomonas sp. ASV193 TaxID=3144405 RepID=UPI0032E8E55D